ncbi:MAG: hypothetical protein H7Z42_07565 [Roseiflexaceae bacterium]|nr:hypothetical protein [Roseiflexaceae bacterium]
MTASTLTQQHAASNHDDLTSGWLTHHDTAALRYMRARLHRFIQTEPAVERTHAPHIVYIPEPDNRQHRVVALNSAALLSGVVLTFVAFFGHKRTDSDAAQLDALDHELIHECLKMPQLLSYSSLELSDGSWANLVLLQSPDGIARWVESPRHAYAAHEVAPKSYREIRIHRGTLPAGLEPHGAIEFHRTRHFAYTTTTATV